MSSNGQQVALEYNVAARCVAVVLKPANDQMGKSEDKVRTEHEIFTDFVDENRTCYWNPHLRESIENLRFAGYLLESLSLLLAGRDIYLNTVLDAWSRRVLRPPQGFRIHTAGEISRLDIQTPSQCLFTPLPEVLCLIISDCNRVRVCATFDVIMAQLQQHYSTVQQPEETFVYMALENLMKERKIYHSGSGYFIVTPDTLQLNNCITVVDNHVIIGSTGSHDNGVRAIYLPLIAAGKMVALEKKSASCQTETKAIGKGSVEVENYKTSSNATGKVSAKVKLCQKGSKKDKDQSGKASDGARNSLSPDTSLLSRSSGEQKSLFKRILYRNKKLSDNDAVKTVKEETLTVATPSEATPCTSRLKSRESSHLQTMNEKQLEPIKVKTKSAVKSNSTRETSGLLRRSCLGFTTSKKSPVKDEMENGGGVVLTRQTRVQRSRSMSPDPRTSSLNLTLDEASVAEEDYKEEEDYKAPKNRTLEHKRKSAPTEKQASLKNKLHFKSTESLYDFDGRDDVHRTGKIFELEFSRPHEVVVKTKRTVVEHLPDSHNHKYISRAYRKYHKMKDSSARKVSRYIGRRGNLLHRAGQSLSQDSGMNRIGEEAEKGSPFLEFCHRRNGRSSGLAKIETVAESSEKIAHSAEGHAPAAEDSGFLSFQLGSNIPPFYPSLEPVQNSIQQNTLVATVGSLGSDGRQPSSEKAASSERSKYSAPHSSYSSFCTSVPLNNSGHGDRGDSLVQAVDSCQTGSSWSNSSRQTVVEMLSEEQIARINLNEATTGNDRGCVDEPCCLVAPPFDQETSLQVDPLTLSESSFSKMPCGQKQTDGSATSRSPNVTTSVVFERQQSGRSRLRGVSSRREICK